jgi:hypothetical protein
MSSMSPIDLFTSRARARASTSNKKTVLSSNSIAPGGCPRRFLHHMTDASDKMRG